MSAGSTSNVSVTLDGWVAEQVRRANRNSLVWNGVVLALLLGLIWFSGNYYYNFFRGPLPVDNAQLLKWSQNPGNGNLLAYTELRDRQLIPTGWQEVSKSDDAVYSVVPYFMTPVGDQYLVVMAKDPAAGKHLIGPVCRMRQFDSNVVAAIEARHPELAGKFLPILLNHEAAFNVAGYLGFFVFIPISLLCFYNIGRALWAGQHPASHKIVRRLKQFGEPAEVAAQINHDIAAGPVARFGKSYLTSLWLLRPTVFGMTAVRVADIVWAYHLKQSESFAVLCLRTGKAIPIPLRYEQVQSLLAEIQQRVPWVLMGYNPEWLKTWRQRPLEIVASSDHRRILHLG